uniref:Uncharacterized protein n=1 Tax=Staphylothermus marinus TaxID=2280 RepID=A0A7C4H6D9_STAMA
MPLLIVDYLSERYSIEHSGLLRRFFKQEMKYLEGQLLEVYEGDVGREKIRSINRKLTCIIDDKRIYLPRDVVVETGVVPHTWIVFSAIRIGDPRREIYYPIYPNKIYVHVPWKSRFYARIEDLFYRSTGLKKHIAAIVFRGSELFKELKEYRSETS